MKKRRRGKREKAIRAEIEAQLESDRERAWVKALLVRIACLPEGLILASATLRPDGGVANVAIGTSDLRRLAHLLTFKLTGWRDKVDVTHELD